MSTEKFLSRHTKSGSGDFSQPRPRFTHIHVDIVGPLPQSGDARCHLMIVDRFTWCPGANPMMEATTNACTEARLSSWISRFDVPDNIATDFGSAFLSEQTAPRANSEVSLAEKVYGKTLATPGEFFPTKNTNQETPITRLHEVAGKFMACLRTFTNRTKRFKPKGIDTCSYVFVRNDAHRPPLMRPYQGPYRVMRTAPKGYCLTIHGQENWVSVDRLKPAFLTVDNDDDDAVNARKGHTQVSPQNKPPPTRCNQPQ
ncbi:uncharacterized protein [Palaemon carinicauda]|uniref:uncharacterized protein n=1 Tax=Palaemon carinicauda TaxID=392227 RepID=UPI0035B60F10